MVRSASPVSKLGDAINVFLLALVLVITLYPLYYVTIISISDGMAVMRGEVGLFPKGLTLDSYKVILKNSDIFISFKNTVVYTVLGTAINIIMSCLCAYPLSRKSFSGRKFFTKMIVVTMFISGGMIPGYLVLNSLDMLDTMWALLLPVAINTYNMIIIRTTFQSLPESLIESAKMDGANDIFILIKIVLPLSKAVLATMVLFYSVSHWNNYFSAMLYLNDKKKYPLQIILRNIVISGMFSEESSMMGSVSQFRVTEMTLRYAVIIFATLPILIVYPFVQKYFVKGVMIGSLKE